MEAQLYTLYRITGRVCKQDHRVGTTLNLKHLSKTNIPKKVSDLLSHSVYVYLVNILGLYDKHERVHINCPNREFS